MIDTAKDRERLLANGLHAVHRGDYLAALDEIDRLTAERDEASHE